MFSNKRILITNDDGIDGEGLKYLVKQISYYTKNIIVIAPDKENSAVSQKMTLHEGIELKRVTPIYNDIETYTITGTPTDCVKIALDYLKLDVDYCLSGINNGLNLGDDILYSGTVAACFEANLHNVLAIAFSVERKTPFENYNIKNIVDYLTVHADEFNYSLLNINIPEKPIGIKKTIQGKNPFNTTYVLKDGLLYAEGYALGKDIKQDKNTDVISYHDNYITITPLTIDRTKYN